MKKKAFLALILSCVMLLSTVTACQTPGGAQSGVLPSHVTPENILPWTGEKVTFRGFGSDLGVNEDPNAPVAAMIQEMIGNVEIIWELVPHADRPARMSLYLSSGDLPDFMWASVRGDIINPGFGDFGMFLDFNNYLEFMPHFNYMAEYAAAAHIFQNAAGELIAIPSIDNDYFGESFFANMDVLDRFGLEIPTTLAEMEAAMEIISAGDPDIIPFHTYWRLPYYKTIFAIIMGIQAPVGGTFWCHDAGEWRNHLIDDEDYKSLIALLADYNERGFFHPEFMTMTDDQTKVIMASGNWAFTHAYIVEPNQWLGLQVSDNNPPINIVPFLTPALNSEMTPLIRFNYFSDNPGWGYAARADVHYPELLAAVLDVVYSVEVSTAYQWGIEGESFYIDEGGNKQWLPEFLELGQQGRRDMGIWNTLLPRFVTWRDDLSDVRGMANYKQDAFRMNSEAVINGDLLALYPPIAPRFTEAQREENALINTPTNTVRDEWIMQIVAGQRPMSDWDAMKAAVMAAGNLQRVVDNFNNATPDPFVRPTSAERHYLIP